MKTLSDIQRELKAPKGQYNLFGKYKYRSCEDILEAVKPLLDGSTITITDEVVMIGERYYIKTIATFKSAKEEVSVNAYAREPLSKKGMDESQITGATSSYARKYALNGLLLIDDTKDADATNQHNKPTKQDHQKRQTPTDNLRNLIGSYTNGFKNQDRMNLVCEKLGIKSLKDLRNKDDITLTEMAAFVKGLIKGNKNDK